MLNVCLMNYKLKMECLEKFICDINIYYNLLIYHEKVFSTKNERNMTRNVYPISKEYCKHLAKLISLSCLGISNNPDYSLNRMIVVLQY